MIVASTNQIRNIVQACFARAASRMEQEGFKDESGSQTTDRYIDVDLRERHQSAKNKPISSMRN